MAVLGRRHAPGHDVAAEYVQHDVEIVVGALLGPLQLRDVPGPDDIWPPGDELRAHPGRVGGLAPAFPGQAPGPQHAVEGRHRGDVSALVEQDVVGLGGRGVHEARRTEGGQDELDLSRAELIGRRRPGRPRCRPRRPEVAVMGRPRPAERQAGQLGPDQGL
jgi:hypothetical protein